MADTPKKQDTGKAEPPPVRLSGGMEAPALGRKRHHYRTEDSLRVVDVKVPAVINLFSGLDPSPQASKDLDPDLEQYIREAVEEIGGPSKAKVVFHLPQDQLTGNDPALLTQAVHNFFSYRAWAASRRLRSLLRRGYVSLAIAVTFLFTCLLLRRLFEQETSAGAEIVSEGLLIVGWVAMWRPLELFLYDWWPLWRERKLYERLRAISIDWRPGGMPPRPLQ